MDVDLGSSPSARRAKQACAPERKLKIVKVMGDAAAVDADDAVEKAQLLLLGEGRCVCLFSQAL